MVKTPKKKFFQVLKIKNIEIKGINMKGTSVANTDEINENQWNLMWTNEAKKNMKEVWTKFESS